MFVCVYLCVCMQYANEVFVAELQRIAVSLSTVNESFAYYITQRSQRAKIWLQSTNLPCTTAHALKKHVAKYPCGYIFCLYIRICGTPFIAAVDKARERFTTRCRSLGSKPVKLVSHSAGRLNSYSNREMRRLMSADCSCIQR